MNDLVETIWARLARQIPALVALCIIVIVFTYTNRHITEQNAAFQQQWAGQVMIISENCHRSHDRVADKLAVALHEQNEAIDGLTTQQHSTEMAMKGLITLLNRINGRL